MWVQKAPPDQKLALTPLLRPEPGGEIHGELCGEPLRVFLHYTSGRSWPCVGRGCCLCKREIPRRYYSYYPVRDQKGRLGIMEMTSQVEAQLDKQMSPVTHVACGRVILRRAPGRRNMPCTIDWQEAEENGKPRCETIDVRGLQTALMRIWNLPDNHQDLDEREWLASLTKIIKASPTNSQHVAQNP